VEGYEIRIQSCLNGAVVVFTYVKFASFIKANIHHPMERNLKALVVDDERQATILLKDLLEETSRFSEIVPCHSADEALRALKSFNVDLIFLDIKMPGEDGLSFLRRLRSTATNAKVVFVTGHEEFAREAINSRAYGYLLKPVDRKELHACIVDFCEERANSTAAKPAPSLINQPGSSKIRINTRTGYFFIDFDDIFYCRADGNYSFIRVPDKEHACTLKIGEIETLVPSDQFVRLGRSLIINFKYLAAVDRKSGKLTLQRNGQSFNVSIPKAQFKELDRIFK